MTLSTEYNKKCLLSTWTQQKILLLPWIFQKSTTWKWHLMNMYQQTHQLTCVPEVTCYGLVYTTSNASTHNNRRYHLSAPQATCYEPVHIRLHVNLWTHWSICTYQKTCYQLFRVINIYIPEDAYYQRVHHTTGNTSTTAYQKWHISTHTRQQKANILNLMVPDVTESLINIPTRWGTLINLQILEQTFL